MPQSQPSGPATAAATPRDAGFPALTRAVRQADVADHQVERCGGLGGVEGGDGVGSAREAFAAELREAVRRVNVIGEIAGEPTQVVVQVVPEPQDGRVR